MSERLTHTPETFELHAPEHLSLPTAEQAEPLRKGEQDPSRALLEARTRVQETTQSETRPNPLERLQAAEKAPEAPSRTDINQDLRDVSFNRELQQIRRRLPTGLRTFSRLANNHAVNAVSEPLAATISRPSGLLGGGLLALLGTSAYLYLAKHQGFAYNYFVFLLLFAGGFVLGLLLELAAHLLIKRRALSGRR